MHSEVGLWGRGGERKASFESFAWCSGGCLASRRRDLKERPRYTIFFVIFSFLLCWTEGEGSSQILSEDRIV